MGYILAGVSSTASAPKGMGGWGKEPEALASAAASSPWAVWRMRMRISTADPGLLYSYIGLYSGSGDPLIAIP
eukprot:COSAG05_NODE_1158_length_5680_cov_39.705787_5_plen_73_part_00